MDWWHSVLRWLGLRRNSIVFTYGRMNPPTMGHELLFHTVEELAQWYHADHLVVVSHTWAKGPKSKNPLPPDRKLYYLRKFFPKINFKASSAECPTVLDHLELLSKRGYKHLTYVCGGDRNNEFAELIEKYNGKKYGFLTIRIVSCGERDPDETGIEGVSATNMRLYAASGMFGLFMKGIPKHVEISEAREMFEELQENLQGYGKNRRL